MHQLGVALGGFAHGRCLPCRRAEKRRHPATHGGVMEEAEVSAFGDEHGTTAEPSGRRDDDVRGAEDGEFLGRQGTAQAGCSECDHPADRRLGGRLEQVAGDETTQAVADDVDDGCAGGVADRIDGALELPRELGVVEPRLVGEGDEVPKAARGEEAAESPEMTGVPEETVDENDRCGVRRRGIELRDRRDLRASAPRSRREEGDEAGPGHVEAPVREAAREKGGEERPGGYRQREGHGSPGEQGPCPPVKPVGTSPDGNVRSGMASGQVRPFRVSGPSRCV